MAGGYKAPRDGMSTITGAMSDQRERLRELERPSGTSIGSLVQQVQTVLANLVAQVNTIATNWMTANAYTKAQIDSKDSATLSSANSNTNTQILGQVLGGFTTTGAVTVGGLLTANPGIVSSDVKSRVLAVGYNAVYIDVNNRMGLSPSSRRFKQDIRDVALDSSIIDSVQARQFRLIGAVEALGDDAPVEIGFIAEELAELGYGAFVTRDSEGEIAGIAYDRLTVPLMMGLKELRAEVAEIKASLGIDQSQ